MKNILIVSGSFFPVNSPRSFRTTELVKEFARQGHKVTLLTVKNDEYHIPFENEFGVTIKDLGPLNLPDINLNKGARVQKLGKRIIRRALYQLFEYPDIELMYRVKKALAFEKGYDLLISIAVPHPIHWGVAWAWREENPIAKTWVADCGDPYMGQTLDSFSKMFYFKYFEKNFCFKADYITVPIKEAKKAYYPEFRDKIRVIPQGFKFDDIEIDPADHQKNPVPTFAYAGGFIPGGRDPRAFLEYLTSIEWDFKFIIFTKNKNMVQPYLERANGNIEIRDYLPRKELLQFLSGMDFLINFENKTSLQLPSKLIDYYLTARPVLSVSSFEIDETVIKEFLFGNYENQYKFENMDRYKIENVCDQFLNLCYMNENQCKV
ncbi:hypothetical protein [Fodinibius sp. Rm-B-1B1-1]|uniref:hypothetical protein n=1 Tax=Fodinibius alkaliphilus TaxID=3140241 RepID=UPI00315AA709